MYTENNSLNKYIGNWLFLMFINVSLIIVIGGLTRLTDSGLSITQWQLFSGIFPPLNLDQWNKYFELYKEIPEYKIQNYSMSLEEFKVIFWWEFIHRLLARIFGIFFLIPLLYFTIKLGFKKTKNLFPIFILICLQGFIGWYMVVSGLTDKVDVSHYRLSLHLFLAFFIMSLILWNFFKYKKIKVSTKKISNFFPIFFLFLIFLQIIIGAFVSGMDGGSIYNTWPLMGSSYFPDDNSILNLFSVSIFNDPSLAQFIHRNLAYFIFCFYLLIATIVYKNKLSAFIGIINIIALILFVQIILGILTVLSDAQIILASMHQIGSILLITTSLILVFKNTRIN